MVFCSDDIGNGTILTSACLSFALIWHKTSVFVCDSHSRGHHISNGKWEYKNCIMRLVCKIFWYHWDQRKLVHEELSRKKDKFWWSTPVFVNEKTGCQTGNVLIEKEHSPTSLTESSNEDTRRLPDYYLHNNERLGRRYKDYYNNKNRIIENRKNNIEKQKIKESPRKSWKIPATCQKKC